MDPIQSATSHHWKTNPQLGHLQGSITDEAGQPLDTAQVAITLASSDPAPATGQTSLTTHTDGSGGYGGVDLTPGSYQVTVVRGQVLMSFLVRVHMSVAGQA